MTQQIKMIWDFKGPHASSTAKHHIKHLKGFIAIENIDNCFTDTQELSHLHTIAFMVVPPALVEDLRKRLKPHRGQLYSGM